MTADRGFNIGISMAGAVSGGAYSAGVFDFLVEALNEWQNAKDRGDFVPQHKVFISAMSGTSAGGITAAMGIASLAGGIRSVEEASVNPASPLRVKRTLPELYDVWVKKVRLFNPHPDGVKGRVVKGPPALLDTDDIKPGVAPDSLLNSDVLTAIARDGLMSIRPAGKAYAFFTKPTHLFLTHTNLDGVPYPVEFAEDSYAMMLHEGRAHFAVQGLGKTEFPAECEWLNKWGDTGIVVDVKKLDAIAPAASETELKEPFETYAQAALTTSAFPFGFSARRVKIDKSKMRSGAMPFDPGEFAGELKRKVSASLPFYQADRDAHFVCIDGGAMNNEPFEVIRWAIKASNETQNARDPLSSSRAVLLIAPFPPQASNDQELIGKIKRDVSLGFIGKALIPALINQARFKASDLIAAADPHVYSRFLISPSRVSESKEKLLPALASSPLQAFGGFLDEQFREHDFQLGRRNCQWFLRQHFTLHPKNPVFAMGPDFAARLNAVEHPDYRYAQDHWPIIPLVGTAAVEVKPLPWPIMPRRNMIDLRRALLKRADALVKGYGTQIFAAYPSLRVAARLSWWRHRRDLVHKLVVKIDEDLSSTGQIEPAEQRNFFVRLWHNLHHPRFIIRAVTTLVVGVLAYEMLFTFIFPGAP